jgi:hypothetical protein
MLQKYPGSQLLADGLTIQLQNGGWISPPGPLTTTAAALAQFRQLTCGGGLGKSTEQSLRGIGLDPTSCVKAGPIGGMSQAGKWKIDARFNREELSNRVKTIASYEDRIIVKNQDATELVKELENETDPSGFFVYADPPYYKQGKALYYSHYSDSDHAAFAELMLSLASLPWVMTYDDVPRIRQLYQGTRVEPFRLKYSARSASLEGAEVFILPNRLTPPENFSKLLGSKAQN